MKQSENCHCKTVRERYPPVKLWGSESAGLSFAADCRCHRIITIIPPQRPLEAPAKLPGKVLIFEELESNGQRSQWWGIVSHRVGPLSNRSWIETDWWNRRGRCSRGSSSCSSRLHYEEKRPADTKGRLVWMTMAIIRIVFKSCGGWSVWCEWVCGSVLFRMWLFHSHLTVVVLQ